MYLFIYICQFFWTVASIAIEKCHYSLFLSSVFSLVADKLLQFGRKLMKRNRHTCDSFIFLFLFPSLSLSPSLSLCALFFVVVFFNRFQSNLSLSIWTSRSAPPYGMRRVCLTWKESKKSSSHVSCHTFSHGHMKVKVTLFDAEPLLPPHIARPHPSTHILLFKENLHC